MSNTGKFDPIAEASQSQGESEGYTSSSMSHSLTPSSSPSSQINSVYGNSLFSSHQGSTAQRQRYWLYIRQQPRAGRASSTSKDRRPIDPPPIIQLLISDFNPNSLDDMDDMRDRTFTVKCLLCSTGSPKRDVSVLMIQDESNGAMRAEKQINGNLDASPFFCDEDPDPATAPQHPSAQLYYPTQASSPGGAARRPLPATFFCFPDLSIRRAGTYRLEFQLMRVRMDGQPFQVLHSVTSDRFNVVNAKDFDHVRPSTALVRGLIARGAGFPLKLKQGSRSQRGSHEE
jgi:Velvet factor